MKRLIIPLGLLLSCQPSESKLPIKDAHTSKGIEVDPSGDLPQFQAFSNYQGFLSSVSLAMHCPEPYTYSADLIACVHERKVLGPFPERMQKECLTQRQDREHCTESVWPVNTYVTLRKKAFCPHGSSYNASYGACVADGYAYGPFPRFVSDLCQKRHGENNPEMCLSTRVSENLLPRSKPNALTCPHGFQLSPSQLYCESAEYVLGPFPEQMQQKCKKEFPDNKGCEKNTWRKDIAFALLNAEACPEGSEIKEGLLSNKAKFKGCFSGSHIFSPKSPDLIELCLAEGRGEECFLNGTDLANIIQFSSATPQPEPTPKEKTLADFDTNGRGIVKLSEEFVGISYWWGGGSLSLNDKTPGKCWKINGKNHREGHSGPWGADCSGFVAKVWRLPTALPLERHKHPYATSTFLRKRSSNPWINIPNREDVKMGDAMARPGHIFIYVDRTNWKKAVALEAANCAKGIVKQVRRVSDKYEVLRRKPDVPWFLEVN